MRTVVDSTLVADDGLPDRCRLGTGANLSGAPVYRQSDTFLRNRVMRHCIHKCCQAFRKQSRWNRLNFLPAMSSRIRRVHFVRRSSSSYWWAAYFGFLISDTVRQFFREALIP